MGTCKPIRDLLFDYLYDLLETAEAAGVREHLQTCSGCQTALHEAQQQQQLLARAAKVCQQVRVFESPDFDRPIAQPVPVPLPIAAEIPRAEPPERPRWRWVRHVPLALAASLLLALYLGYQEYRKGVALRQSELAQAQAEVARIDAQYAAVMEKFAGQRKVIPQLAANSLHLQVSGQARYHPEVPSTIRLETRDAHGQPQKANLNIRMIDPVSEKAVFEKDLVCPGESTVQVPAGLAGDGKHLVLDVQARTATAAARLQEELAQVEPDHVTHLVLNKLAYHIGEVLFFRTLSLEHYSLKPPTNPLHLRYGLVDQDGKTVKQLEMPTGPGGIGGGTFALTSDIPSGVYFLEVAAVNGTRSLPQRRQLEILRDDTPRLETDRNLYRAGEKADITLRYPPGMQNAAPLANQNITWQLQGPKGAAAPGGPVHAARTDNLGKAPIQIPMNAMSQRLGIEVQVLDGKTNEKLRKSISVVPATVNIDFFPEGGELVEGVPARVYYRVRSPQGEPVDPEGRVIVMSASEVLFDSEPGQGVGVFDLVPKKDEKYTVRITSPQTEVSDPFQNLGIRPQGLVLSVPSGVTRENEPLRTVLGYKGHAKRLLVLATCRGQIVDQQSLVVKEGRTELGLKPVAGAAGVLRVTVYEAIEGNLLPLAERLVFRVPERRLNLMVSANEDTTGNKPGKDKSSKAKIPEANVGNLFNLNHDGQNGYFGKARPGQSIAMRIVGQDENKNAIPLWALAAVVNEKSCSDREPGLPAHFYLNSVLRGGAELEDAHLLVRDAPESRQALDLFLGTQGWRRFVAGPDLAMLAQATQEKAAQQVALAEPAFFSTENANPTQLRERQQKAVAAALAAVDADLANQRQLLAKERDHRVGIYNAHVAELNQYQKTLQDGLRLALGLTFVFALLVGTLLLVGGLARMMLRKSATPVFATAVASLGICLIVYFAANNDVLNTANTVAGMAASVFPEVPPIVIAQAPQSQERPPLPSGQFVLTAPVWEQNTTTLRDRANRDLGEMAPVAKRAAPVELPASAGIGAQKKEDAPRIEARKMPEEYQKLFKDAQTAQDNSAYGAYAPASPPAANTNNKKDNKLAKLQVDTANYVNSYARSFTNTRRGTGPAPEPPDTVLWHPALFTADGTVQIQFDLLNQPVNYRVLIQANTPDGRLGFYEGSLEVTAPALK